MEVRLLNSFEEESLRWNRAIFGQTGVVRVKLRLWETITYQLVFEDDFHKTGKIIKILFKVDETNFFPSGTREDWYDIARKVMEYNDLSSIDILYESQDKETGQTLVCNERTLSQK